MRGQDVSQHALKGAHIRLRKAPLDAEPEHLGNRSAADGSGVRQSPRRQTNKFRINRLLGQLVPLILLVYISAAYDLVVYRFAYGYLYRAQRRILLPVIWLLPAHVVFLTSLKAYLKVFLAHSSEHDTYRGLLPRLRRVLGARFPAVASSHAFDSRDEIRMCQANGEPVRCWRDSCNGRIKAFRTRHCGDCGTCRIGLDHHCPWFDNDVTLSATMRPFLLFLLSIPPLFFWCLGPLIPTAVRHTREIWLLAVHDAGIRTRWWGRWYSWCGGPIFRWAVGWIMAGRKIAKNSYLPTSTGLARPSMRPPVIVGAGALFTSIAMILAFSSIRNLVEGKLTIDVEREKSFRRASASLRKAEAEERPASVLEQISAKLQSLTPEMHFLVPSTILMAQSDVSHAQDRVLAVSTLDSPFKEDTWTETLRYYLFGFAKGETRGERWGLNPRLQRNLIAKARAANLDDQLTQ